MTDKTTDKPTKNGGSVGRTGAAEKSRNPLKFVALLTIVDNC